MLDQVAQQRRRHLGAQRVEQAAGLRGPRGPALGGQLVERVAHLGQLGATRLDLLLAPLEDAHQAVIGLGEEPFHLVSASISAGHRPSPSPTSASSVLWQHSATRSAGWSCRMAGRRPSRRQGTTRRAATRGPRSTAGGDAGGLDPQGSGPPASLFRAPIDPPTRRSGRSDPIRLLIRQRAEATPSRSVDVSLGESTSADPRRIRCRPDSPPPPPSPRWPLPPPCSARAAAPPAPGAAGTTSPTTTATHAAPRRDHDDHRRPPGPTPTIPPASPTSPGKPNTTMTIPPPAQGPVAIPRDPEGLRAGLRHRLGRPRPGRADRPRHHRGRQRRLRLTAKTAPTFAACEGAAGSSYCTWEGDEYTMTVRVRNEAAAEQQQHAVTEVKFAH